jgi:hypothetical protein
MNERIRELADEAGLRFTQLMSNPMVPVVDGKETDLAKFAQLIVRECAGIVENKIAVSRYVHEAELLRECSTTIKLHFGVEE